MEKEKKPSKWTLFLEGLDARAERKGRKTIWQIVKFLAVSLLISIIQLVLVNLLYFLLKGWKEPLPHFLSVIFSPKTVGENNSNWGYVLPFFLSNLIANTIGYILNKKRTFKSDAPKWHYVIYIVILVLLILFTTWLQGVVANWITSLGIEALAPTIAMAVASTIQGFVLFPLQKFVLLREKKNKDVVVQEENGGDKNE